jgi:hypothetical protein
VGGGALQGVCDRRSRHAWILDAASVDAGLRERGAVIHIGFTGTRYGMTALQHAEMRRQIVGIYRDAGQTFHHGDCVGADEQFHRIVRQEIGGWIVGHLPIDQEHRAFCDFDETRAPLKHMQRNAAIVKSSAIVFAAPYEMTEQDRGGTWRTVQMARKAKRELVIVFPDGSVSEPARLHRDSP